ncbi:MAG: cation:dicarboxylase symporter family transporter [Mogibacterium sp.]|nr:cation:dicarboxylase symporter family transporter [Mogibacterium sp.]
MDITNKRSQENRFELKAEEIDRITEELDEILSNEPIDRKDALRLRFIIEEVLLNYRDFCSEGSDASLWFSVTFGRFRISLKIVGDRMDPFTEQDPSVTSVMGSMLANSDSLNRAWKYRSGANLVTFTLQKKRKMSQIVTILIGLLSGMAAGFLIRLLLPDKAGDIASKFIIPLTNAYVGLLCVMATILCFAAIVLGIVRLGDISTFSTVGKKMIRSFLAAALLLTMLSTACMIPGQSFGSSAKMSINFLDFFDILISFVPNNILSPILEFNSVHIIIVGIMFGVSMLHMGQKADNLTEIVDEVNIVAIVSNSYLNRFIPAYVGLMVCGQYLSGANENLAGLLKLVLMVMAADLITLAAYTAFICFRLRVSARTYIHKLLPSFIISLSSANVGAAFTTTIDTLIGPLGLGLDYGPLAYNLGSILFRPGYCIVFTACSIFTAGMYGVEVTWSWVVAAFMLSFILSVATPPVMGGTTVCFSILFSQLGLNSQALAMIISINAFFEFMTVAVNNYCLQSQIVLLGNSIGELDADRLRKEE